MRYLSIFKLAKLYSAAITKFAAAEYWIKPNGSVLEVRRMHIVTALDLMFSKTEMLEAAQMANESENPPKDIDKLFDRLHSGRMHIYDIWDSQILNELDPIDLKIIKASFNEEFGNKESAKDAWGDPIKYFCSRGYIRIRKNSLELYDINNPERKKTIKKFVEMYPSYRSQHLNNPCWIRDDVDYSNHTFMNIQEYLDTYGKEETNFGLSDTQLYHRINKEPELEDTRPGLVIKNPPSYESYVRSRVSRKNLIIKMATPTEYWIRPDGESIPIQRSHFATAINLIFNRNKVLEVVTNNPELVKPEYKNDVIKLLNRGDDSLPDLAGLPDLHRFVWSSGEALDSVIHASHNAEFKAKNIPIRDAWKDPILYLCKLGWIRIRSSSVEMCGINDMQRKETLKKFIKQNDEFYNRYLNRPVWLMDDLDDSNHTFKNISEYLEANSNVAVPVGLSDSQFFHRMYDAERKEPGLKETRPGWNVAKRISRLNKLSQITLRINS